MIAALQEFLERVITLVQALITHILGLFNTLYQFIADLFRYYIQFLVDTVTFMQIYAEDAILQAWLLIKQQVLIVWNAFTDYLVVLAQDLGNWLIDSARAALDVIDGQLADWGVEVSTADIGAAFGLVADAYADAAWLLPLNEVMAIVAVTFTTIAIIRAARWVLSFLWITG